MSLFTPRPYQYEGASAIRQAYLSGRRAPMYVLPTGGGKTVLFCYIAEQAVKKGSKVLILVHRIELLRQTQASIMKLTGMPVGIINSQYTPNLHAPIQVASVQTLVSRIDLIEKYFQPNLIIIDECHHANANSWRKIIDRFERSRLLGVTATPCRTDGSGLGVNAGGYFDELILGPDVPWLMDEGYLVRAKLYGSANQIDLSDVDMVGGDYKKGQLKGKIDKPTITGDIIEHYRQISDHAPAIGFCVSVEHAEHVAEQFRLAGYRSFSVDGSLDDEIRQARLNGLADGSVEVLTSCDLISEGTDIPVVTTSLELRPTASTGLNIQQRGRVLRPVYAKGFDLNTREGRLNAIVASIKPHANILDHVGNWKTHGFPDDVREWSLEGAKKRGKGAMREQAEKIVLKIRQCPACFAIHEYSDKCNECGHVYPTEQASAPKQVDGQLRELTKEDKEAVKRQKRVEVAMAKTYEDLLALEKRRNYKPGWAAHVWAHRGKKELML